jgi:predicted acylesterase/phospholipase RssA
MFTPQLQMQQSGTSTPEPANVAPYYSPPPRSPVPSGYQSSPQQYPQVNPSIPSPSHQPQLYSTTNQQQFPNQLQQYYQQQLTPMPEQQLVLYGNQQYQPAVSTPPPPTPYQLIPQESQSMSLQQQFQALSVSPALSPSFKEITKPRAIPTLPKKMPKDGPAPSVLRVEREGHNSTLRKILCLDGGGVRGMASLMILKHLMQRLKSQRGGRLEPWQEFDMIAGTSTGGLIAIMLGRLRMSVEECIETYKTLSQRIFTPVHSKANIAGRAITKLKAEGKFESEPLEKVVKEICRSRDLPETELLKDESADAPKVFVCAAQGTNSDAVVIRSYASGSDEWDDLYDICKIWEAARATSAASTFFDPIQIGDQKYVDGALRYNNPIEKADQESRGMWAYL